MKRREYKKHVRFKKNAFFAELSLDVEQGRNINWARFNKLKKFQPSCKWEQVI